MENLNPQTHLLPDPSNTIPGDMGTGECSISDASQVQPGQDSRIAAWGGSRSLLPLSTKAKPILANFLSVDTCGLRAKCQGTDTACGREPRAPPSPCSGLGLGVEHRTGERRGWTAVHKVTTEGVFPEPSLLFSNLRVVSLPGNSHLFKSVSFLAAKYSLLLSGFPAHPLLACPSVAPRPSPRMTHVSLSSPSLQILMLRRKQACSWHPEAEPPHRAQQTKVPI